MEPGRSKVAFGGDVNDVNRYWYFFAHAADGGFWASLTLKPCRTLHLIGARKQQIRIPELSACVNLM
ncbi:MAG: hypothetical protein E6H66_10130 [Betaproteobacteria bacterium]|nr:MAG: hypothetical protein E6H66_10130 [Betaproteobacteria bacterium]